MNRGHLWRCDAIPLLDPVSGKFAQLLGLCHQTNTCRVQSLAKCPRHWPSQMRRVVPPEPRHLRNEWQAPKCDQGPACRPVQKDCKTHRLLLAMLRRGRFSKEQLLGPHCAMLRCPMQLVRDLIRLWRELHRYLQGNIGQNNRRLSQSSVVRRCPIRRHLRLRRPSRYRPPLGY